MCECGGDGAYFLVLSFHGVCSYGACWEGWCPAVSVVEGYGEAVSCAFDGGEAGVAEGDVVGLGGGVMFGGYAGGGVVSGACG